ncbi:unnamed protein product [Toxocara canis]|uniref:Transposase n=1 Tax=Toxocara canis TaxID=6265 RepID=A0A183UZF2_TOXCA|nr:unnamed protein product [Toxocara canis]
MSEKMQFTKKDVWRYVKLEGNNCYSKPIVIKTWSYNAVVRGWVPAKEMKAFVDGNGYVELFVEDNLVPSFRGRNRFFCSFGSCW